MTFASKEKLNELYVLENEYFKTKGINNIKEKDRCILRGELVKGFVKTEEMVQEAIEKLTIKINNLKEERETAKAKELKEAKELEETEYKNYKMVALVGSNKQVKWANDIRKKVISDIEELKEQSKQDKGLAILKNYFYNNGIKDKNISIELIENTLKDILETKNEAVYYIDNRFEKAINLIIKELKNK